MSEISAVVVEYGGKSYIRLFRSYGYGDTKNIAANGRVDLPKSPGDDAFLMLDAAPVTTLQKITPPRRITTKYELRADLRGASKEEVLSVDQYRALKECDQGLYRAIQEDLAQQAEDIPFVIQKEDGPPSKLPAGVVCTDKNYFARFPSFHHLGPVRATARYVLYRLAIRFAEIIGSNPFIKNSMHGVPADPVKEILNSHHRDSFFIEVTPMKINGIEVRPTSGMHTMFSTDPTDRSSYCQRVAAIDGEDLADLEVNVAAFIDKVVEPHSRWVMPDKCPCCQRPFAEPPKPAKRRRAQ
jgi:hypothetical protein